MGKHRKARKKKAEKLEGEAAVAWLNEQRRGRPWEEEWAAFLARPGHQDWWALHGQTGPVYTILSAIASHLSEPPPGGAPIFSDQDVRIEIAFYRLCKGFRADIVGVWGDQGIRHPLLAPGRSLSQLFRDDPTGGSCKAGRMYTRLRCAGVSSRSAPTWCAGTSSVRPDGLSAPRSS